MSSILANADLVEGAWLALTGMLIVFAALALVSLFIAWVPRGLALLNRVFPESGDSHPPGVASHAEPQAEETLLAAVALALHHHRRR